MSDEQTETGLPRWVKIGAIVAAVLVLLVVVVMLVGGGHSPRRHGPPADSTSAPAGHRPPGIHG